MNQPFLRLAIISAAAFVAACASRTPRSVLDAEAAAHPAGAHEGHAMGTEAAHKAAEIAFLFPDGDDKGWSKVENGMGHNMTPELPLSKLAPEIRAELLRQLSLTMDVIRKYPTVKAAEAAGYRRAGPFIPGLGTHYVGPRMSQTGVLSDADIQNPSTIIYDGLKPDSPIAGFMYIAVSMAGPGKEPEGFAGPNDRWHIHQGICLKAGANGAQEALGFDGSITQESCTAQRAMWVPVTQYLLHVWTVPGYPSPLGVFAHTNPGLTCADGTYYTDDTDITNKCKARE